MTDTSGHRIALTIHTTNIQDWDGAPLVFARLHWEGPKLCHVFADGGYAGPKLRDALVGIGRWTMQVVKRSDTAKGFEVLPLRWVVERTFA
jgi:transposase